MYVSSQFQAGKQLKIQIKYANEQTTSLTKLYWRIFSGISSLQWNIGKMRGGGVWTTGYASILRFTVLPEILSAYKHINHCFSVSRISIYSPWIINKLLWVKITVFDYIYNYNSYVLVFYHILTIMRQIKFELVFISLLK